MDMKFCVFWVRQCTKITKFHHGTNSFFAVVRLGLALVCIGATLITTGQNRDIKFHHLTVQNGLPSNTVNSIIHDSRGYIWIATENGVSRYDGYTFSNFRVIKGNSWSISSNITYTVFEDTKNRIWVGTQNGLDLFNRKMDRFENHFFSGVPIRAIYQDRKGNLWVGCDQGLYKLDNNKNRFVKPFATLFSTTNGKYNTISCILEDHQGNLWVGSSEGIYVKDNKSDAFNTFVHDTKTGSLSGNRITGIIEDSHHRLWIATYGGGINLFQPGTKTFKSYLKNSRRQDALSNNLTNTIWEAEDGKLWIGTDGNGVDIFDPDNETFSHVIHSQHNLQSLNNSVVRFIGNDKRGGIWLGTYEGGINFYHPYTEPFFNYKVPTISGNSSVTSFAEETNGNLWIGTDGGGLCYFNRATTQFINLYHNDLEKNTLGDNRILSLLLDHQGYLWIGTYLGGLCKFNTKTKTFYYYNVNDQSKLSDNIIWTLLEDRKHRILVGTNKGINVYNPLANKFNKLTSTNSNLSNDMIRSMYEDTKGRLWIGTQQGLNLLSPDLKHATVFRASGRQDGSLSNDWIRTIAEDANGRIWVGTFSGLNLYNEATHSFTAFGEEEGLLDNNVSGIVGDTLGNIWVSTGKGLTRLSIQSQKIRNYHVNDGLQGDQFNLDAAVKTHHGEFLFGSINGFTLFNPVEIVRTKSNKFAPPVVLTSFKVFNKEVIPNIKGSVLHDAINETTGLRLAYNQSVFTFEFAALNFIQPEGNHYAYKLDGFEEEWNYVGNKRSATYTNIEPGHYTFRVKASNNNNVWNEKGISFSIVITPPFWRTWWFISIGAIAGIFICLILILTIRKRIREKIEVSKLITELKMKALMAQMNPHFIFNCLTSIQELIMTNRQTEAMHYLNKFSRLLRTVLQIINDNHVALEQELMLLKLYLELESMRFSNQFHYEIDVDKNLDTEEIVVPPFLLQPFVENALWHGLMHKKGDRKLVVSFMLENENLLVCTIDDNGIGREDAERIRSKNMKTNQSLGLQITRERIRLMRDQHKGVSLRIIDKQNINGLAEGTTAVVKLPLITPGKRENHTYIGAQR